MTKLRSRPLFITFAAKPRPPPKPGGEGGPVTTMMLGEEDGRPDAGTVTSLALGEEGGER